MSMEQTILITELKTLLRRKRLPVTWAGQTLGVSNSQMHRILDNEAKLNAEMLHRIQIIISALKVLEAIAI